MVDKEGFLVHGGLDFLFSTEPGTKPVRWKQFLATWSALYPLSLTLPLLILPALRYAGLPPNRYADIFVLNGVAVALMVYFVMPRYTKLIHRWLFK